VTPGARRSPPARRHLPAVPWAIRCGSVLLAVACSRAAPPPAEYVLGVAPAPGTVMNSVQGRPIVEVRPVRLPDYLDTRDLLTRSDNQIVSSTTGQWAERLSVGMTRAIALSLDARLPNVAVVTTSSVERPTRLVLVDVTAFEARADHQVVLLARWTITDGSGRVSLVSRDAEVVEPIGKMDDAAVVSTMNRAVEALASQIADGIRRDVPPGNRSIRPPE